MSQSDDMLAVLREIRDQQAQHHRSVMERLAQRDVDAQQQTAKREAEVRATQEHIRKAATRFFLAVFLALLAFLFGPMIGHAMQSFFARLAD